MADSNGMPADQLQVTWRKSKWSNPSGNCVEVAELPGGGVAVRTRATRPALPWSTPAQKSAHSSPE
jgi:uncharacterized protein DUF397